MRPARHVRSRCAQSTPALAGPCSPVQGGRALLVACGRVLAVATPLWPVQPSPLTSQTFTLTTLSRSRHARAALVAFTHPAVHSSDLATFLDQVR